MSKKKLIIIISSVVAAVIIITLAIVLPLTLTQNNDDDSKPPQGVTQPDNSTPGSTQPAQTFINSVKSIETPITLDSKVEIDASYIIYGFLNDADKDHETVKEYKELLDGYMEDYGVLKAQKDEEDRLAMQAVLREDFVKAVENLPDTDSLTLENKKDIEAVHAIYEQLDEQSREYASVKSALDRLVAADSRIEELELEAHLAEVAKTANEFIEAVEELCGTDEDPNEITLESYDAIDGLLYDYGKFSDEVKEYEGVAEAKEKLDKAFEEYQVLKDEQDVETLIAYAKDLSPVENVTLDSERTLTNAEYLYKNMSEAAKSADGVAEAYAAIQAAREKYDELFAENEAKLIKAFIAAANAVNTNIDEMEIGWYKELDAAMDAYWLLSPESQRLPEVEEAFERWNTVQTAFDKRYERLKLNEPNMWIAGDGNLVLENELTNQSVTGPLCKFYGVDTKEELDGKAILWLNVYVNGEYQGKTAIKFADISAGPGHIVLSQVVEDALKRLAAENENVVRGARYSFTLSCEDRENKYIPSSETKLTGEGVYNWQ